MLQSSDFPKLPRPKHPRWWLMMSITSGLELQSSGSCSGHLTRWGEPANVTEALENFSWKCESKFNLLGGGVGAWLGNKKNPTPKPEMPHVHFFDVWKTEMDHLSINSQKTNLWGRWCQSRGCCRGSVGKPICQYCSCYFSNAFTNW